MWKVSVQTHSVGYSGSLSTVTNRTSIENSYGLISKSIQTCPTTMCLKRDAVVCVDLDGDALQIALLNRAVHDFSSRQQLYNQIEFSWAHFCLHYTENNCPCFFSSSRVTRYAWFCDWVGLVKEVHNLLGGVLRFTTNLEEVEQVRQKVKGWREKRNQCRRRPAHLMSVCRWDDTWTQLMTWAMRCSVQCDDALIDKGLCTNVFVLMCSVWKSVLMVMLSLMSVV